MATRDPAVYDPNDPAQVELAQRWAPPRQLSPSCLAGPAWDAADAGRAALRAQPAPTGNGTPILPLVIADLTAREENIGKRKYGTVLRAHNGRNALQDALEEAYDQVMYLRQLREEWPQLLTELREGAFREVQQLIETSLQDEDGADPATELGRVVAAVNGALRRLYSGVLGLQGKPPVEPEPRRMRKPHRWKVITTPNGAAKRWGCRDCPVERWSARGPRGGPVYVFAAGGQELARGAPHLVRVPLCPPAPKGER